MTRLTLGSLFDGIGGFPYAASFHGIKTLWGSEIEPFPINVTKKQFPGMEHLGDITEINGAKVEPVDIVTFGSPCQGLSVAGAMGGLEDERSGLFVEAVRIIRELRRATGGRYPRFVLWENVPGAFSTNKRQDFRAVLSEITETDIPMPATGKWAKAGMVRTERVDVAWRVFDAQYWGVSQRRKRIYLVADFTGQCAGEILFECQGMSGNIAEGGKAGEEVAGSVGNGVEAAGLPTIIAFNGRQDPVSGTVTGSLDCCQPQAQCIAQCITAGTGRRYGPETETLIPVQLYDMTHAEEVMRPVVPGLCPTLNARMGTGGNQIPVMLAFCPGEQHNIAHSVRAQPSKADKHSSTTYICEAYPEPANTLPAKANMSHRGDTDNIVRIGYAVRRLTPTECLRLQGFPDDWLADVPGYSDTAAYKAIGNSLAIPPTKWILGRIADVMRCSQRECFQ